MKLTIGKKLISGFVLLALLVVVAGFTGILMVQKVARSGEKVLNEDLPFADVAMEASIVAEKIVSTNRKLLLAETGLDEIEAEITEYVEDFDMFIKMLKHGTESSAFKNSPAGQMYEKDGLDLVVPQGDVEVQTLVDKITQQQTVFNEKVKELNKVHRMKTEYIFSYKGVHYSLPGFLYATDLKHRDWMIQLHNAVEYEVNFTGELDPTKGFFGEWYANYQTNDKQLADKLVKFQKEHVNFYEVGKKVVAAPQDQKKSMLIRGQRYLSKVEKSLRSLEKYAETTLKGLEKQERAHVDEIFTASEQIRELLIELEALADKKMALAQTGVMQAKSASLWTLSVLMACSVVLALVLGFSLSRNIAVPMQKAVSMIGEMELGHLQQRLNIDRDDEIGQMARSMDRFADSLQNEVVSSLEKLAKGDLTFEISPRDERDLLRGSLQKLGNDLNEIMTQVQVASDQIDSGSSQVSESAQSLSQGATQSAASVEEISSSMQEIGAQTNQSAENAQQANILAIAAAKAAKAGGDQMVEMVAAMDEINDSSQNISKIIKVIDEIAFQTNLLALNAAVEAARAGQHGKGFAVVAEEVRNLAARSAKAASETAELIEGSVEKAGNGTQIAKRTAASLEEIAGGITKVTDLVAEIAAAGSEQAQGVTEVNQGLQQVDQVIQQSTANAEESAATAEELSSQSAELKKQLSRFILKNQSRGKTVNRTPQVAPQPDISGPEGGSRAVTQQITLDDPDC